ncbi:MAG: phosphate signaling complex protein PhoU [Eubacteriales bacterium]|nr:phosphate signaling complex protein PhoU [Eubacteriales bacterium]
MTTRKLYSKEMEELTGSLEEMSNLVEASLENLFFSIEKKDKELASRIIRDDHNVNSLERSIESQCLLLITTQQPIAGDLRLVSSVLKVVTDVERIGDHASDIAELILQMDHTQLDAYSSHLKPMITAAREMVHEAVSAFIDRDEVKAGEVIKSDDIVDSLFDKVKHDIAETLKAQHSDAFECIDALMIAKYLERIGDHAVNICEWEIFRETGTIQDTQIF